MPWPNLLYDQTDLARLCINWDVQPLEYHVHNPMFGFDQLLRVYAALPNEPLPWTMEHFLSLGDPPRTQVAMRVADRRVFIVCVRWFPVCNWWNCSTSFWPYRIARNCWSWWPVR